MPVKVDRQIGNGMAGEFGLSILGIGMVTSVHAAISPSFFTFNSFAKKPTEKAIARRTLWISLAGTTAVSGGLLLLFGRWLPAIVSEVAAVGLFVGGMLSVEAAESAPEEPTMAPKPAPRIFGPQIRGLMAVEPRLRQARAA